jgi:hypothetical protein
MANRQTNLDDFLYDLVCFIEEKLTEALADPASQFAAIKEAACAIPLMRQRLGENELRWAQFVLVLGVKIETDWWQEWWRDFAKMQRDDFFRAASEMLAPNGALQALKSVVKP